MRSLDGDAKVNAREHPTLVLVGISGSGKTCVAQEIAKSCGLRVQEDQELLESAYSRSFPIARSTGERWIPAFVRRLRYCGVVTLAGQ